MSDATQSVNLDLVHRVCAWIREEVSPHLGVGLECAKCPLKVDSPYGPGTQVCVLRAQELIEIVQPAHEPPVAPAAAEQVDSVPSQEGAVPATAGALPPSEEGMECPPEANCGICTPAPPSPAPAFKIGDKVTVRGGTTIYTIASVRPNHGGPEWHRYWMTSEYGPAGAYEDEVRAVTPPAVHPNGRCARCGNTVVFADLSCPTCGAAP